MQILIGPIKTTSHTCPMKKAHSTGVSLAQLHIRCCYPGQVEVELYCQLLFTLCVGPIQRGVWQGSQPPISHLVLGPTSHLTPTNCESPFPISHLFWRPTPPPLPLTVTRPSVHSHFYDTDTATGTATGLIKNKSTN